MNLPEKLRQPDGVVFVKDVNMSGVTGPEIGPELAALVEAADVVCDSDSPGASAHDLWRYETARAALVAALGGDK